MGMRALITGINGFTGPYVANELERAGYEIFGLTQNNDVNDPSIFSANLLDKERLIEVVSLIKPDIVVHLAAISFVAHGNVDEIYHANVLGTRNLLSALVECCIDPKLVLLASSANVYGNAVNEPITESVNPAPVNDYAVSKLSMEYMARTWLDKLPIVISRPFNYTGVGQSERFLPAKIVSHFCQGKKDIELGNLDIVRDFSDVRTLAEVYRKLIEKAPIGGIFNVCSGLGLSLAEILSMMEDIAGYKINVTVNPAYVRSNEVKRLVGSNEHLKKTVGNFNPIPMRQTLEWMYRSYKTQ